MNKPDYESKLKDIVDWLYPFAVQGTVSIDGFEIEDKLKALFIMEDRPYKDKNDDTEIFIKDEYK